MQTAFVTKHAQTIAAMKIDAAYASVASSLSALVISSVTAATPTYKTTFTTNITTSNAVCMHTLPSTHGNQSRAVTVVGIVNLTHPFRSVLRARPQSRSS